MASITYLDFLSVQEKEEYPPTPEQLVALRTFFADPSVPISDVAHQIVKPVVETWKKYMENPETINDHRPGILWRTIANAVKQLTEYNDRLVELVVAIQKIPDPEGYIANMSDFREHWTEFAFMYPMWKDPDRAAEWQAWRNINTFCAKLSTYRIPQLDQRGRVDMVMRHTLERTPCEVFHHTDIDEREAAEDLDDETFPEWREHELELRDIRKLNNWVPIAAVWFRIDGRGLYEMEGPMEHEYDWDPSNWKGPTGWSKERFSYWRERFEWISKVTVLEKSTRKEAAETAELMKKIENGG